MRYAKMQALAINHKDYIPWLTIWPAGFKFWTIMDHHSLMNQDETKWDKTG